jgi:hypothetical protein
MKWVSLHPGFLPPVSFLCRRFSAKDGLDIGQGIFKSNVLIKPGTILLNYQKAGLIKEAGDKRPFTATPGLKRMYGTLPIPEYAVVIHYFHLDVGAFGDAISFQKSAFRKTQAGGDTANIGRSQAYSILAITAIITHLTGK